MSGEVGLYFQELRKKAGHRVDEWHVGAVEGNLAERHRLVVGVDLGVLVEHRGGWRDPRGWVALLERVGSRRGLIQWVMIQIMLFARA